MRGILTPRCQGIPPLITPTTGGQLYSRAICNGTETPGTPRRITSEGHQMRARCGGLICSITTIGRISGLERIKGTHRETQSSLSQIRAKRSMRSWTSFLRTIKDL